MRFDAYRSPRQYRSLGIMFDGDDFEWNLTVSLWWWDWQWEWTRRQAKRRIFLSAWYSHIGRR